MLKGPEGSILIESLCMYAITFSAVIPCLNHKIILQSSKWKNLFNCRFLIMWIKVPLAEIWSAWKQLKDTTGSGVWDMAVIPVEEIQ